MLQASAIAHHLERADDLLQASGQVGHLLRPAHVAGLRFGGRLRVRGAGRGRELRADGRSQLPPSGSLARTTHLHR